VNIKVLGESLMDCISQSDGSLRPIKGGSPYNMARAACLQGAQVEYLNPMSSDVFGVQLREQLVKDQVTVRPTPSRLPTSLAVVNLKDGQPSYGFYREGIADRDYTPSELLAALDGVSPGILHTGSLLLIPPEHTKVLAVLRGAKAMGWIISVDVNMRPSVAPDLLAYNAAVEEIIGTADWLKASDEDLATLGYATHTLADATTMAGVLMKRGISRLALTYGGDGAYLQVGTQSAQLPVPPVKVVDTVGAGDTFWGNCIALWSHMTSTEAEAAVSDTLRHAMLAAAINCTRQGCQPPTRAEVLAGL
jgi:fructokinase